MAGTLIDVTHFGGAAARVVIAAGGTAGHVQPALSVARALRDCVGVDVSFIGASGGFETLLVPSSGFAIDVVRAEPLFRKGRLRPLVAGLSVLRGVPEAERMLRARAPKLVLGFGGYATVAALTAARKLGIPTAIHEANTQPGVANAVLAPWVDRVHSAQPNVAWPLMPRSERVCGHPIRPELQGLRARKRQLPQTRPVRVLVIGGSQGSPFINRSTPELLARVGRALGRLEVIHQTGASADLSLVDGMYRAAGTNARVVPYLSDIGESYTWADYVISAAGAGALAEISAAGLPVLLVPFAGAARNHQQGNAQRFAERTGALIAYEDGARLDELAGAMVQLLSSPKLYEAAAQRVRAAFVHDAAQRVALSCLELMGADSELARIPLGLTNVVELPFVRAENAPLPSEPPRRPSARVANAK